MLTKQELTKKIVEYVEANQPEFDWGNLASKEAAKDIIEKGKDHYMEDIWDYNVDYVCELEGYLLDNVEEEFADEIAELELDNAAEFVRELVYEHVSVNYNEAGLLRQLPDIDVLLIGYRNTDCCNSIDDPFETSSEWYIGDVYSEVKHGVKRKDFAQEFYEGAYGGSLFMFGFRMGVEQFLELKEKSKEWNAYIKIPKGTQFGFHSSFQGCSSMFEHTTHRPMWLKIKQNEYDEWALTADIEQHYSIEDVFGQEPEFSNISDPEIKIVKGSNSKEEGATCSK